MLRTGLVGIGKMGISHLAIAGAHADLDVVGICDSQGFILSALSANTGIPGFKKFDRMLDELDLDCAFISTPTSSHFDLASKAIERGVNLFLEKPLTLSYAQSSDLAARAQAARVANQVGYHNRFIATFAEVARLLHGGAIGAVHHVDGRAYGQVITKPSGGGRTWRSHKSEGGGCLHDYACHVIDLMNFLVGKPKEVVGAQLSRIYSTDVEDAVYALFSYGNGSTGTLETNWSDTTFRKMSTSVTIYGDEGKIYVDRQECRVYLRNGHSFEDYESGWTIRYITDLQAPVDYYLRGEEYSSQIDAFATASRARDPELANSFASAADADWVVERIMRVAAADRASTAETPLVARADGRTVVVPPWLDKVITSAERGRVRARALRQRVGRGPA